MTTIAKKSKNTLMTRLQAQQAGFDRNFTGKDTLTVAGNPYGVSAVDTEFGGFIKPYADLGTAVTAAKTARTAVTVIEAQALQWANDFEAAVKGYFGPSNPILEDFGIALPKAREPLSPEQQLKKTARSKETRELRGTMGSKQKAKVKSTSQFVVSTTAAAASGAAPAASAPAAAVPSASSGSESSNAVPAAAPAPAVAPGK